MNKKILAAVVVALVGLPMAAAATTLTEDVVTGHTVYANMGGFDPDVALIAGIVENKVVWFNGVTVLSTLGYGFVYAVEDGQCNPIKGQNYTFEDYSISYRDPNNIPHIVAHYTYQCGGLSTDGILQSLGVAGKEHVWITATHDRLLDPAVRPGYTNSGRIYNFGTGVDTSLFDARVKNGEQHDGMGGATPTDVNDGDSYCPSDPSPDDHVCTGDTRDGEDTPHTHNVGTVNLFFHKEDRGRDATNSTGAAHPGTVEGCAADAYCDIIQDTVTYPSAQDAWAASWNTSA